MTPGRRWRLILSIGLLLGALRPALAGQDGNAADKEALAKRGEAFVEAFNKGDAKELAQFWTEDGDYTDQVGHHVKGREAIAKVFDELFAEHKGLKLQINSKALKFVTPDVAIEDGTTAVIPPGGMPPTRARYTIVHVKKGDNWYLNSVRDAVYAPPSNREHLQGLEWAIGDWAADSDKGPTERLSVEWTDNENFLIATFSTTVGSVSVGSATQWIGWDPVEKRVRSWIFDAAGGFGEGAWSKDGKQWVIKTSSVRQDGKKAAATYVLTAVDEDSITLQGKDRTVDGNTEPDTKVIKLKRVK